MADAEEPREPEAARTDEPAATRTKPKKKKKRVEDAKPAPLPGAGTPDGDKLREAFRAFDAGDYRHVRACLRELERAEDPAVRDAAAELLARISIDPVQVGVVLACAVVLATIAYVWVL